MGHFGILAYAVVASGTIGILADSNALDTTITTFGIFAAIESFEWVADKIMARCRARRAQ